MLKRFIAVIISAVLISTVLCSCCLHKANGDVTCTEDSLCKKCGEVLEKALGHTPDREAADCVNPQKCTVCNEILIPAKGHTPSGGDACTQDIVCTVCGDIVTKKTGHKPDIKNPTCITPSICTVCGKVVKEATGHTSGAAATDTDAQKCTTCGLWVAPPLVSGLGTPKYQNNKITALSAAEGSYIPETKDSDHFVKGAFNRNSSGGIVSSGNYMMESFKLSSNGSPEYAQSVTAFAKKYPKLNISCMIVPKCATFEYTEETGDLYTNHKAFIDATYKQIKGAKTPDAFGTMEKHRGEYLFYRTDHHWTSLGAYYASVAYCKANDIKPRKLDTYKTVINTDFWGTLYTTFWGSNVPSGISSDYTAIHMPKTEYILTYSNDENAYFGTAYGTAINQSAKNYAYAFLGGDRAFTHIVTAADSKRKLLVFKESYGNALVPYMIDYFKEIIVIDIRHSDASTKKLIKDYGITDVLIINNIQAVGGLKGYVKERLES